MVLDKLLSWSLGGRFSKQSPINSRGVKEMGEVHSAPPLMPPKRPTPEVAEV